MQPQGKFIRKNKEGEETGDEVLDKAPVGTFAFVSPPLPKEELEKVKEEEKPKKTEEEMEREKKEMAEKMAKLSLVSEENTKIEARIKEFKTELNVKLKTIFVTDKSLKSTSEKQNILKLQKEIENSFENPLKNIEYTRELDERHRFLSLEHDRLQRFNILLNMLIDEGLVGKELMKKYYEVTDFNVPYFKHSKNQLKQMNIDDKRDPIAIFIEYCLMKVDFLFAPHVCESAAGRLYKISQQFAKYLNESQKGEMHEDFTKTPIENIVDMLVNAIQKEEKKEEQVMNEKEMKDYLLKRMINLAQNIYLKLFQALEAFHLGNLPGTTRNEIVGIKKTDIKLLLCAITYRLIHSTLEYKKEYKELICEKCRQTLFYPLSCRHIAAFGKDEKMRGIPNEVYQVIDNCSEEYLKLFAKQYEFKVALDKGRKSKLATLYENCLSEYFEFNRMDGKFAKIRAKLCQAVFYKHQYLYSNIKKLYSKKSSERDDSFIQDKQIKSQIRKYDLAWKPYAAEMPETFFDPNDDADNFRFYMILYMSPGDACRLWYFYKRALEKEEKEQKHFLI
jgi:hypothetical protein